MADAGCSCPLCILGGRAVVRYSVAFVAEEELASDCREKKKETKSDDAIQETSLLLSLAEYKSLILML